MSGLFVILALDDPGTSALRQELQAGHVQHFRAHASRLAVAGPLAGDAKGSIVIIDAESASDAEAFIKADPFYEAGIWHRIEIYPFRATSGRWAAADPS